MSEAKSFIIRVEAAKGIFCIKGSEQSSFYFVFYFLYFNRVGRAAINWRLN